MEEDFRALLLAGPVAALVPAGAVNWGEHPQGAGAPYIVLEVISAGEGLHMKGPDGLERFRVQADCYAAGYGAAKGLARALRGQLHGYRGGGFRLIEHADSRDHGRGGGSNEAERLHRVGVDFIVHWRQT